MRVVLINEYKSCKISYQMLFNVMFSFSKTKTVTGYDINIAKYNYLVVPFRMVHLMNHRLFGNQ